MLLTSKKYRKQTSYVLDIQEKTGTVIFRVGDISSLFPRHCQTNRLNYSQAVLYHAWAHAFLQCASLDRLTTLGHNWTL